MPVPVIRSDAHLAHDGLVEVDFGRPIPGFEVPARAIEIERALSAASGYRFEEPTHHGEQPILAVHDQALLDVLATAWDDAVTAGVTDGTRPLIPGTLLTTAYAAGHDTGLPGPGIACSASPSTPPLRSWPAPTAPPGFRWMSPSPRWTSPAAART